MALHAVVEEHRRSHDEHSAFRRDDVRVGDREVELDAVADAKPAHAVVEAADEVGDRAAERDRVPRIAAGQRLDALDSWMKREVITAHHVSSTCKMGPSNDPLAVVDQYGKVYGVDGLRIIDASIMPDTVRANLNLTVLAMAERAADFIKES